MADCHALNPVHNAWLHPSHRTFEICNPQTFHARYFYYHLAFHTATANVAYVDCVVVMDGDGVFFFSIAALYC